MPIETKAIPWDEVRPLIEGFCVWTDHPEMAWFQKAWKSLEQAGWTNYTNDEERHWVLIRAMALGIMYGDYCELEWDEYSDEGSIIGELYWDETFNHLRIGAMAADWVDSHECDPHLLFTGAILSLVGEVRLGVYDALAKGFGGPVLLYVGLWESRTKGNNQDNLDSVVGNVIDESGCLIEGKDEAFAYVVVNSMLAKDA